MQSCYIIEKGAYILSGHLSDCDSTENMLSFINLGRYRVAQFLLETNAFKMQDYNITNKYYSCLSTSHALQYSVLDVSMQVSEASFVTTRALSFFVLYNCDVQYDKKTDEGLQLKTVIIHVA